MNDGVNHPNYYGGKDAIYETIKVLEAWMPTEQFLGYLRCSAVVYMHRAGRKPGEPALKDLAKAAFYIEYEQDFLRRLISKNVGETHAVRTGHELYRAKDSPFRPEEDEEEE